MLHRVTFFLNTTPDHFAQWIEGHTAMSPYQDFPSDTGRYCLQPVRGGRTARHLEAVAVHITPSTTEPDTEVASFPFRAIEFKLTPLASERIEVEAQCHQEAFTGYLGSLLAAVAERWPEAGDAIALYLRRHSPVPTILPSYGQIPNDLGGGEFGEGRFTVNSPAEAVLAWLEDYGARMPVRFASAEGFLVLGNLFFPSLSDVQAVPDDGTPFLVWRGQNVSPLQGGGLRWMIEAYRCIPASTKLQNLGPAVEVRVIPLGDQRSSLVTTCNEDGRAGLRRLVRAIAATWPESGEANRHCLRTLTDSVLTEQQKPQSTISDYVAAGESETVEFKRSLRWDVRQNQVNKALEKTVARTVGGFMNSRGGTLVVGVSDEGNILGLECDFSTLGSRQNRDGWEQAFRNVLNTYLSKEIAALVEVSFAEVDGKTVAVARADPARRPVYLTDNGVAEFYIRSGNTTQQLDVKQANEYVRGRFPTVA